MGRKNKYNWYNVKSQYEKLIFIKYEEADILNMALFGMTVKEWRVENSGLDGNMRNYATINELICLANLKMLMYYTHLIMYVAAISYLLKK